MPTRNQHFVPRVYLKRWSPKNNENVFYYNWLSHFMGDLK
jgi:hypothetical protein